ncbi:unnamed protein product [Angiostrongylus costaricensis]|uniref:PH domain-containing protein n=1 Tax=Angiostrongylus costaricensis TaxID=334426 RepID=A0A158PG87_ANGCS|nr:unnamed protein product [Angiostrongylus costaricensis]
MFATSGTSASFGKQTSKCMFSMLQEAERANLNEPEDQRHSDHPRPPQRVLREISKGQTTKKTGHDIDDTIGMEAKLTESREDGKDLNYISIGMPNSALTLSEIEERLAALRGCDVELIRRPRCIFESAEKLRPTGDTVQGLLKEARDLVEINDRYDPVTELERRHKRLREEGEHSHSTKAVVEDDSSTLVDGLATDTEGQRLSKASTATAFSEASAKELEEINRLMEDAQKRVNASEADEKRMEREMKSLLTATRQKSLELEEVNRQIGQFWDKQLEKECISESEDESLDEETVKKIILEADQTVNEVRDDQPSSSALMSSNVPLPQSQTIVKTFPEFLAKRPFFHPGRPVRSESCFFVLHANVNFLNDERPEISYDKSGKFGLIPPFDPLGEKKSCGGTVKDSLQTPSMGICCANRTELLLLYGLDNSAHADPIWERPCSPEQTTVTVASTDISIGESLSSTETAPSTFTSINERLSTSSLTSARTEHRNNPQQLQDGGTDFDNELSEANGDILNQIGSVSRQIVTTKDVIDSKSDMNRLENRLTIDERTTKTEPNHTKVLTSIAGENGADILGELKVIPTGFPVPASLPLKNVMESQKGGTQTSSENEMEKEQHIGSTTISPMDVNVNEEDNHVNLEVEKKDMEVTGNEEMLQQTTTGAPVNRAAISIDNDTEFNRKPIELTIKSNHTEEEYDMKEEFSDNRISNEPTMELVTVARLDSAGNSTNSDDGLHKLGKQKAVSDIRSDSEEEVLTSQLNGNLSVNDSLSNEKSSTDGLESKSEKEAISTEEEASSDEALSKGQHLSINDGGSSALGNSENQLTTPNFMPNASEEDHSTTTEGEVVRMNAEEQTSTEPNSNVEAEAQLKSNLLEDLPNESESDKAEMTSSSMTSSAKAMLDDEETQKGHDKGILE